MISTFDLVKLHSLLKDFYTLTRIRTCVFDENFNELASYPESLPSFCRILRAAPNGYNECRECDARSCSYAARTKNTYTYRCYAGMTESISPLVIGNLVVGYLLLGHVFSYQTREEGWEKIKEYTKKLDVDYSALKKACWERPLTSEDYIKSATKILSAVGIYLCMERMVSLHQEKLPVSLDTFLQEHFTEDLTSAEIASHFKIGRTRLYELCKQNYGRGPAKQIQHMRLEKAKVLLTENSDLSISEIAYQCGYPDYNYFITVFHREIGISPGKYREQISPPHSATTA